MILKEKINTPLSEFLSLLFSKLEEKQQLYCICGNYHELPYYTKNDVDIWTKNPRVICEIIEDISREQNKVIYLKNKNATGTNFFIWYDSGKEIDLIHIDVLVECRWYSFLPLVKSHIIEKQRKKYNGFFVANDTVDAAMHFMYPLAHFGKIPAKYKDDIKRKSQDKFFWEIVETGWGKSFSQYLKKLVDTDEWSKLENTFNNNKIKIAMHSLSKMRKSELKSVVKFISSNFQRYFYPTGLFIAFIGPDGCGKTTALNNLQPFFQKGFTKGKIKKFYWRPFLLPRIKQILQINSKEIIEDNEDPSERLKLRTAGFIKRSSHCIKLLYYFIDYLLGRIKYQGAWSRGGIVCFDRYWDDLLIFPERFGLNVPRSLVKILGVFIPKPDIIFYLHAEPDVLIARKPELPYEEMSRQIRGYKDLMKDDSRFVLIEADCSENEVLNKIIRTCLEKMSKRYPENRCTTQG